MKDKNIFEKLQDARIDLQNMKLKKSGKNQNISYYELGDFLPAINSLCAKHGLFTCFRIIVENEREQSVLSIYSTSDTTQKIDFVAPTAEVQLPRGQAIQGLGAKLTYMRRYMLMTAFEMVESDMVDAVNRELADEIDEADLKKIADCKSTDDLTPVYKELEVKYKKELLVPHFAKAKTKLQKEESNA